MTFADCAILSVIKLIDEEHQALYPILIGRSCGLRRTGSNIFSAGFAPRMTITTSATRPSPEGLLTRFGARSELATPDRVVL